MTQQTQNPYSKPSSPSGRRLSSQTSPRVVTPKQALSMRLSPKASKDVPENAVSFQTFMEYIKKTYWEDTGLCDEWRDIRLYEHRMVRPSY